MNTDDTVPASVVAGRLERVLRARGMRPAEIARHTNPGARSSEIYQWLRARFRPRDETLMLIAQALKVPVGILLGRHTLLWSGQADGKLAGHCADCKTVYHLDPGHTDEELTAFQHMHWGIPRR